MIDTVFSLEPASAGFLIAFHILIVDDGSPDGTALLVKQAQEKYHDRLFLLERAGKQGLGTAYIAGFKWGLDRAYDFILEMDADFSHNPSDLIRLVAACKEQAADLSVGSRYVRGGRLVNWTFDRILLSRLASLYVRLITWMPVHDSTAGFVCYKRVVLETIHLERIRFIGYAFQIEMKFAAYLLGFKIKEVPITFSDRELGVSKMSSKIIKEALLGVLDMRWKSLFAAGRSLYGR